MEGMGLKFTPGIGRRLLRHLSMFGPMAGTSGTHIASPKVLMDSLTHLQLLTYPSTCPSPITCHK